MLDARQAAYELAQKSSTCTPAATLAHMRSRTHARTQIHPSVSEEQLVRSFRGYGEVVSHCLIRASSCAFIDFLTHAGAAEAKRALAGVPCALAPAP